MKKALLFLALLLPATLRAQLQQHDRQTLFDTPDDRPLTLAPGESFSAEVRFGEERVPVRRSLRIVGGTRMPAPFEARGETRFRQWESRIDDLLDSVHVTTGPYSLYFEGAGEAFERRAYNRIGGERLRPGRMTLSVDLRQEELSGPEGSFGIEIEVFLRRADRHPDEIFYAPDTTLHLPFPAGSSDFRTLTRDFELPEGVGALLLKVGGEGFGGRAWVDGLSVTQPGQAPLLLPFVPHDRRPDTRNYWVGINLTTRNWPLWRLDIDGRTLLRRRLFDRASNVADLFLDLPDTLHGTRRLTLTLEAEPGKAAFPYDVRRIQLLTESRRDFELVAVPAYPAVGDTAALLLEINRPGLALDLDAGPEVRLLHRHVAADSTGLLAVPFEVLAPGRDIPIRVQAAGESRTGRIVQSIVKSRDGVYLSSGDEIYLDKTVGGLYDRFFKWYVGSRIGNWYQFRPSFQWSGVRETSHEFLHRYLPLLEALRMPYAWQVEGRTLAASRINPALEALAGPMFRGKQAHENDGCFYYWQHFPHDGLCSDMCARTRPYGGIFAKHPPIYTDHGTFIHYDPYAVTDMADGAGRYVRSLAAARGESTRHTGPSTTFRYLYQAGYEWLGAEQMYGPEETILSALRGASRAYGKREFGTLHAMQWGSFPFTDPAHAERFFLSLAVAYIHGASHINTEEGLWTDEYANDRYTEAGQTHLRAQHLVLDFAETHTRRGAMRPRIAVLQGRNDAWKCFGRTPLWSQEGQKWRFDTACESFDLLGLFYPEHTFDFSGPSGWFTSTPYGPVDLLPVEAPDETLADYDCLVFLGWNTYDDEDFARLERFVRGGGTLLLSAAHLNAELQPDAAPRLPENLRRLRRMLGSRFTDLTGRHDIPLGRGRIVYFAEPRYPADPALRPAYEEAIREEADRAVRRETPRGWIAPAEHIGFTAWDAEDRRTLYVLNNDWSGTSSTRPAVLLFGGREFPIDIPRWSITAIHCFDDTAVLPLSPTADVLRRLPDGRFEVQCTESTLVLLFRSDGTVRRIALAQPGIHRIE